MVSKLEKEAAAFAKKKGGTKPPKRKKISLHNRSLKVGYRDILIVVVTDIGETQKGGLLAEEETEEKFVYSVANYLSQIFRDNKWLLPYMQSQFNG